MAGRIDPAHQPRRPHLLRQPREEDLRDVIDRLAERDVNLREIAELISARPGLEAFLMTAANSVHHGLEHRVRDVHHAVVLLGIRRMLKLFDVKLGEVEQWNAA
ncbi:HDOD domain protein [Maioricimonas rarisocia]|uniref:HDOD domain protein n=1 Tax=Maioricimonas rarisocia TaxID=2528026 RepID=A0A517ZCR5_9PLAN|nr:HDOD domain-containing protein [Maioricimonas rarisocia]QDU40241.1 HDOD domain protein [Maioricimonas rarisocia]